MLQLLYVFAFFYLLQWKFPWVNVSPYANTPPIYNTPWKRCAPCFQRQPHTVPKHCGQLYVPLLQYLGDCSYFILF